MGFSSWTCAKTNLPILVASWRGFRGGECSRIVALLPDGRRYQGDYDGYGRLENVEPLAGTARDEKFEESISTVPGALHRSMDQQPSGMKLVLAKFYAGEAFSDLPGNHYDPGQGHYHDEGFITKAYDKGGYQSFEEYKAAFEEEPEEEAEHQAAAKPGR